MTCPVCWSATRARTDPVDDDRDEIIVFGHHRDTAGRLCAMSGRTAAARAVTFTAQQVA